MPRSLRASATGDTPPATISAYRRALTGDGEGDGRIVADRHCRLLLAMEGVAEAPDLRRGRHYLEHEAAAVRYGVAGHLRLQSLDPGVGQWLDDSGHG